MKFFAYGGLVVLLVLFAIAPARAALVSRAAPVRVDLGWFRVSKAVPVRDGGGDVIVVLTFDAAQVGPNLIRANGTIAAAVQADSKVLWQSRISDELAWGGPSIAMFDGREVLLALVTHELLIVSLEDGEVLQRIAPPQGYSFDDNFTPVASSGGIVVALQGGSAAVAVFDESGLIQQITPIDTDFVTSVVTTDLNGDGADDLLVAGGSGFRGEDGGGVFAVSLKPPDLLWAYDTESAVTSLTTASDSIAITHSVIEYCCGGAQIVEGKLTFLDFRGCVTRVLEFDGYLRTPPSFGGDHVAIVADGYFTADASHQFVDTFNYVDKQGQPMPGFPLERRGISSEVQVVDGYFCLSFSGAYVPNPAGVYFFDPATGNEMVRYLIPRESSVGDAVVSVDMLVVPAVDGRNVDNRASLYFFPLRFP